MSIIKFIALFSEHAMKILILQTKQPSIERHWGDQHVEDMVMNALQDVNIEASTGFAKNSRELEQLLTKHSPDLIFPNGYWFLDEQNYPDENTPYIAQYLEEYEIPFVGVDNKVLKSCLPKKEFKKTLSKLNISTPEYYIIEGENYSLKDIEYPVITKLNFGAESIGVYKIYDEHALKAHIQELQGKYHQPIVLEKWYKSKEYTVAILGNGEDRQFLPLEIKLPDGFSYMEFYLKTSKLKDIAYYVDDVNIRNKIENFLREVAQKLNIRDWSRFDLLEDEKGELMVIDLNMLPGLRYNESVSYFPLCTKVNLNMDYNQTIYTLVSQAMKRNEIEIPQMLLDALENNNTPSSGMKKF